MPIRRTKQKIPSGKPLGINSLCKIKLLQKTNNGNKVLDTEIAPVNGVKDIYFVCRGKALKDIMFFDYWTFSE